MKKLLLLLSSVVVTGSLLAQQTLEIPIDSIGKTYPVSIGVTNSVNSDFAWSKTGGNTVINSAFTATTNALTSSQNITLNPAVTAGMSSTVTVSVSNTLASSCVVSSSNLIVSIVATPTFNAVVGSASQNVCQSSTAANLALTISGPVGSVVSTVNYTIGSTPYTLTIAPAAGTIPAGGSISATIDLSGFSTATVGSPILTVNSVSGTNGGPAFTSGQTGLGKTHTINVRAVPAIGNFSF